MTTKRERDRRLALVERTIHEHGWSMRVQIALAAQIGVTRRTIQQYKSDLVEQQRRDLEDDRPTIRAEFLTRLRGHQQRAAETGKTGALSSMMALEADIVGIRDRTGRSDAEQHVVEIRVNAVET